jgi:hypothetical protein
MQPFGQRCRLGDLQSAAAQIAQVAANAGFSGPDLATAVAIALAESGGNPAAYNREPGARGGTPQGQGSYGLWQIYLKKHPEFAGQNLFDPQTNANAAFSIYSRRGGFSDWATYSVTGTYRDFLSTAQAAVVPPLTIDASTGQPIEDSTPTPAPGDIFNAGFASTNPAPLRDAIGSIAAIAAAAILGYIVFDEVLS